MDFRTIVERKDNNSTKFRPQMNSLGVGLSPSEASHLLATNTSFVDGDFSTSAIGLLSRTLGLSPREMVKVRCCAPSFSIDDLH